MMKEKTLSKQQSVAAFRSFSGKKGFRSSFGPNRGFTLVEMLVVGALIAIFSTIAIISVQSQLVNNRRKAIIGEARSLATAMDFAYNDIGFFPSLGWLKDGTVTLDLQSEAVTGGDTDFVYRGIVFQHYGIPGANPVSVRNNWAGPYHASTQTRSRVSQGRGGSSRMILAPSTAVGGGSWNDTQGIIWPLDALNNPWMMYNLNIDRAGGFLYFTVASEDNANVPNSSNPGATGNFINAIVSYGDNQLPGGGTNFRGPSADLFSTAPTNAAGHRLYIGDPNSSDPLTLLDFVELGSTNGILRASAWSSNFYGNAGGNVANLALSDDNSASVGITDPGSDDIVFTF